MTGQCDDPFSRPPQGPAAGAEYENERDLVAAASIVIMARRRPWTLVAALVAVLFSYAVDAARLAGRWSESSYWLVGTVSAAVTTASLLLAATAVAVVRDRAGRSGLLSWGAGWLALTTCSALWSWAVGM